MLRHQRLDSLTIHTLPKVKNSELAFIHKLGVASCNSFYSVDSFYNNQWSRIRISQSNLLLHSTHPQKKRMRNPRFSRASVIG